jgi:signal peptidase I
MDAIRPHARRRGIRFPVAVVAVAGAAVVVRAVLLIPVQIDGGSMEPTLHDGDVALVWRASRAAADLHRGDLVVFRDPAGDLTVKRVVGLPGDRVAMLDAMLTVDGVPVDEPYVDHAAIDGTYLPQVTVPEGAVWVLGDNRGRSIDSRQLGPVTELKMVGRVLLAW